MSKKVAYIIVCWNNKKLIEECIDSIYAQTYKNADIYLIDNNSADGSADFVQEKYPEVKLLRSSKNNGFAVGNNLLIEQAIEDPEVGYFALINTDARIDPGWSERLVEFAEGKEKVACMQTLTVDYYNPRVVDSHHVYLGSNFQSVQAGYRQFVHAKEYTDCKVMGVNAAAAMYTREYIEAQPFDKLFDESFFMYLEDVDVALRAINMGWSNYFVTGPVAYHMGSASSATRSSDFSLYWTARNQYALLTKNMPFKTLVACFPKFARFEIHFILHLKRNYSSKTMRTYLKGRFVGTLRAPLYLLKRRKVAGKNTLSHEYIISMMAGQGIIG